MTRRILVAVTHLLGAGHLTRAAALARAFARAGHDTTLVSGGTPAPLVSTDGVRFVQLPPVRTRGVEFGTLRDEGGEPVTAERLRARRELMLAALAAARPDAVVTELFPFGRRVLAAEFTALLDTAHALAPRPLVLASIRDVLASPSKPGRAAETEQRLRARYDGVLVHTDPALAPLEDSWPIGDGVRPLLRYTGYVDEGPPVRAGVERRGIVASGGSSAAALPLLRAACGAARFLPNETWRLLAGASLSEAEFEAIRAAAPMNATVERARPDFRALLAGAALSVSQAGYNTAVDLLRAGPRALLVPFAGGRETEQALRAELLRRRGLAAVLPEAELSAENLARMAARLLAAPLPEASGVRLDGAARTVAVVEAMWEARAEQGTGPPGAGRDGGAQPRRSGRGSSLHAPPRSPPVACLPPAGAGGGARPSSPLDEALRRAEDAGVAIDLWWRDDDAVSETPALNRLLALARSCRVPLALAVIPALVEPSLAPRLAETPDATVLTHGYSHRNHAAPGSKKVEFGPDRPVDAMKAELADGLRRTATAFGARSLPVLVPPWNRIAPALRPVLPSLGYAGLSTFGPRGATPPLPGLAEVNTHLDPIEWRGGRGLVDRGRLEAGLARAVLARAAGETNEPIGLLTHHLVHDEAVWSFCEAFWERLSRSPACRYPFVGELFSRPGLPRVTEP